MAIRTNFSANYDSDEWVSPETKEFFLRIIKNWDEFNKSLEWRDFYTIYDSARCFKRFYIKKNGDAKSDLIDFKQIAFQYKQWRAGIKTKPYNELNILN